MTNLSASTGDQTGKEIKTTELLGSDESWCRIQVRGHLGNEWSDWFGELDLQRSENGETILSGRIADQGALIGILSRLNRLNLILTSIRWSEKRGEVMV